MSESRPTRAGNPARPAERPRARVLWLGALGALVVAASLLWWRTRDDAGPDVAAATLAASPHDASGANGRAEERSAARRAPPLLAAASISGVVRDAAGDPIGAAWVCVTSDAHGSPTCAAADARGRYRVAPRGAALLRVHANAAGFVPGFAMDGPRPATVALEAGEARSGVDVVLVRGGVKVHGVVTDVLGGPIEAADVTIAPPGDAVDMPGQWRVGAPAHARTDDEGRFVAWVEAGSWTTRASAPGYADVELQIDVPRGAIEIAMIPEATIAGVVVARDGGEAIANARVILREWTNGAPADRTVGFADGSGHFRIGGLTPGRYRPLAALGDLHGEASQSYTVELAEAVEDVRIEVVAAASVTGTVVVASTSTPCSGGSVRIVDVASEHALTASIAADGTVLFEGVLPARYDVAVACDDHSSQHTERVLVLDSPGTHAVTWVVERGHSVRGRVVDDRGDPRAARITAFASSGSGDGPGRMGHAGADGQFEITGFGPGQYAFTASTPGGGEARRTVEVDRDGIEVELRTAPAATLTGRVQREGAGVSGLSVSVRSQELGRSFRTAVTDEAGQFRVDDVPPGRHVVGVTEDAGATLDERSVDLVAHEVTNVEFTAAPTATIGGVVRDADGGPVADALISALASTALSSEEERGEELRERSVAGCRGGALSDGEGRFTLSGLARGATYTVVAQRRGGGVAQVAGVAPGSEVELRLHALASVRGRINTPATVTGLSIELRRTDVGTRLRESFALGAGRFAFDKVPAGRYEVIAVAREGRGRAQVVLVEGRETDVSIALTANRTLRGRFVDLMTGNPVSKVVAVVGDDAAGPTEQAAKAEQLLQAPPEGLVSDADGVFAVPDSPSTTVHMLALGADVAAGAPSVLEFIVVAPAAEQDGMLEVPLVLRRPGPRGELGVTLEVPMYCSDTPTVASIDVELPGVDLRVGDEVIAIDEHDVRGRRCYLARQLMTPAPHATVRLSLARGPVVELRAKPSATP